MTTGCKYSRGDAGVLEKPLEWEYRKWLAGFSLHNVAVTPLWLVMSLRSRSRHHHEGPVEKAATVLVGRVTLCDNTNVWRKSHTRTGWGRWGGFRRNTWSSVCRGGSEQPWPAPEGPCRYSALRHGCPRHCKEERIQVEHCKYWNAALV